MTKQRNTRKRSGPPQRGRRPAARTSWDPVATWYDGWVGKDGSKHHQKLAVPAVLRLLDLQPGEAVLDIGAGQGVLARHVAEAGASYVGVEASPRLRDQAEKQHGQHGRFLLGDATKLQQIGGLAAGSFDAAVFLLSLQDMDPLKPAVEGAAWALRDGGRVVLLLTHPAFRVPRQSGWGWDEDRKLRFRRVDSYLTPLPVPMKSHSGGATRSFHRPLSAYINTLGEAGLLVDRFDELVTYKADEGSGKLRRSAAEVRADQEFPLFLAMRAVKAG